MNPPQQPTQPALDLVAAVRRFMEPHFTIGAVGSHRLVKAIGAQVGGIGLDYEAPVEGGVTFTVRIPQELWESALSIPDAGSADSTGP